MGRLKSLQPSDAGIHSLFSIRYRKLVDAENNANNNHSAASNNNNHINSAQLVQNLIRLKMSQDYIAYCCGQCGHRQRFDIKADELQSIVGDALLVSRKNAQHSTPSSEAATLVLSAAQQHGSNDKSSKNFHSSWTRQFHDKSKQSKSNNIEKWMLVEPENNLKETNNKCKCNKGTRKALIKDGSGSGGSGGGGAVLVMPSHAHHPLMMGYKPLMSSLDLACTSSNIAKQQNASQSSSRSPSPSDSDITYLPTLPVRTDSLTNLEEEALLKSAPWFQAGIPREISLEILQQEPIGSFLVRESTSKPGCYALSVRVPKGGTQTAAIAHYLITQTNRGFKIKGFTKEFPSLTSLIVHHSVMPELLPCPLLLHRPSSDLLADYLEHANNFVDIDSSILLELTRKRAE